MNNVIFWIITLIVHRNDFFFVYTSLFFRGIRQNLRIIINESKSHKTKHLRLEYDIFVKKHNIFTHVLFFHKFSSNIIHFDEITQRQWIDDIVLSILRLNSFKNILQHHFRNYNKARTKIHVRNEIFFIVRQYDHCLNVIYFVSKFDLFVMWIEMIRFVNVIFKFRDIQLMIMRHDLKLTLQFSSLSFVRQQFTIFLNIYYHRIDVYMSSHKCWLDVSVENVWISNDDCDITLLRKSFCLKHWVERFRNFRDNVELIFSVFYSFMLIRDADFFNVEIKFNNSLRITNELNYHKTYNSNKNLFNIIMKNYQSFDSFYMKSLNFIQTKIDYWHVVNVRDSNVFVRSKKQRDSFHFREHYVRQYEQIKQRMTIVFEIVAETEICFNVRQKYQMILIFFNNFRVNVVIDSEIILIFQTKFFTNDQNNVFNDSNSSHRSYWIFTIDEIHQFMFSIINRWMIFVEVLTFRTCRNIDELTIVSIDKQRVNNFMMSVAMRIMRLLFEKLFIMTSKLWKHHWNSQSSNRRNFERQLIRRKMLKFDYKITHKNFETMWLSDEHIHWKNHFKFHQIVFARLNFFKNVVQRQLRDDRNVFQIVIRQFRFFEFFRTKCQLFHANFDRFSDFIDVVFQFVIRRYIFRIFDIFQIWIFERARN